MSFYCLDTNVVIEAWSYDHITQTSGFVDNRTLLETHSYSGYFIAVELCVVSIINADYENILHTSMRNKSSLNRATFYLTRQHGLYISHLDFGVLWWFDWIKSLPFVSVITDNIFMYVILLGSYSFFWVTSSEKCLAISKVPTKFCVIKGNPVGCSMLVTGAEGGYLGFPVGPRVKNNLYC